MHKKFLVLLISLLCAGATHAAPPRVFDAAALGAGSGVPVIQDVAPLYVEVNHANRGTRETLSTPAVVLRPKGRALQLDFGTLPVGLYQVDVLARLDRDFPESQRAPVPWNNKTLFVLRDLPRVRRPIVLSLNVNDGPNGGSNDYRMLVNYTDDYTPAEFDSSLQKTGPATARFFFQVNEPRAIKAEIRVTDDSLEGLRVKSVTLIDFFDGIARTRAKVRPMLFTAAERERVRAEAASAAKARPAGPQELDAAERRARDDMIWDALPRFNTQHYQPHGGEKANFWLPVSPTVFGPNRAVPELKDDARFQNLGQWYLAGTDPSDYHLRQWNFPAAPLVLKHQPSGAEYSMRQLYDNEPLPGRPFRETPQGAFFPAEQVPELKRNHYVFTIGELMFRRYMQFVYALADNDQNPGLKLTSIYYGTGDRAAARDAAMMLIRLAYAWPALQLKYQDLGQVAANPNLDYGIDTRGGWKAGKIYYHGWSGPQWQDLLRAYDKLYDFIDGNQELADAVHRHLPWIETPDDVIALLDTYLVRAGIKDFREHRIAGDPAVITTAALVLGKGEDAEELMDLSKTTATAYPITAPWLDLMASAFNRDGTHYIGSWGYARGGALMLLGLARDAERFKAAGGTLKFDATDVARFPKVAAAASTLLDAQMAGGYSLDFGDASGNIWSGRSLVGDNLLDQYVDEEWANCAWRLTGDPRWAWIVVHVFGRTVQDDVAWQRIVAAAKTTDDPRLHTRSRVLGGLGAAILERGSQFRDYRLKEALVLRTGSGQGHSHNDALDLNLFALGARMATDTATRSEGQLWSEPPSSTSMLHNTVEVDGKNHPFRAEGGWPAGNFGAAEAWVETFKPLGDVQFVSGAARSKTHSDVKLFRRESALIGVEEGRESTRALPDSINRSTKLPNDVALPRSYVFDVFRVAGGRWHTWCFHGAVSDDFQVNGDVHPLPADGGKESESDQLSRNYLRKLYDPKVGVAPDMVEATWRLSRTGATYQTARGEIKTEPAEQNMLGVDYDEAAPRRYTRVSLLGQGGNPILVGSPYSQGYKYLFPFLYVQLRGEAPERESVFPAIIEAYQGAPTVTSKKLLQIDNNETDARRAVAIEVATINNHTDICYAGGRPEKVRTVRPADQPAAPNPQSGIRMSGEFAYLSRDAGAPSGARLRAATLIGGQTLQAPEVSIRAETAGRAAKIIAVDYDKREVTLDAPLPEVLAGQEARLFNDDHRTSYTIEKIQNRDGHAVVTFKRTALMARSAIDKIEGDKVTLTTMPFAGHEVANRAAGWTATNENHSRFWKTTKGGWNAMYRFAGAPVTLQDFSDADGDGRATVLMYDYGIGDNFELPTHVSLVRTANGYEVRSDVAARIKIGARTYDVSPSAQAQRLAF